MNIAKTDQLVSFGIPVESFLSCIHPPQTTQRGSNVVLARLHLITLSKLSPLTDRPAMAACTFRLKLSLFCRRSSAASLFSGSDALGSRKRNCSTYTLAAALSSPLNSNIVDQDPNHSVPLSLLLPYVKKVHPRLTCSPTITAFRFSTGFQSSLKIFKHTFPSRSMFGW